MQWQFIVPYLYVAVKRSYCRFSSELYDERYILYIGDDEL